MTLQTNFFIPEFKAILWDMDGTLVDSEPFHKLSTQIVGREIGRPVSDALYEMTTGIAYRGTYDIFNRHLEMPISYDEWYERVVAAYASIAKNVPARGNTVEVVRAMQGKNILQAIVSNSNRMTVEANTKGFLRHFDNPGSVFQTVIPVEDVKRGKPDPEGYLLAASRLGVAPRECLVIEDSPTGVAAGIAAGCFTIYWPEHAHGALLAEPDIKVDTLDFLLS